VSRGTGAEEEGTGEEPQIGQPEVDGMAEATIAVAAVEQGLVDLAEEMAELIERAPAAERESLHDYAVSLVREKLPAAFRESQHRLEANAAPTGDRSEGAGVHLIGYGLLLLPVAFLMMLVFAPLGTILLAAGLSLSAVGLAAGLLRRLRAT
jgi:hypothetical protein